MNPVPVVLYGDLVRLEPLDAPHADDLVEAAADESIWRFMPRQKLQTVDEVRRWIKEAWKHAAAGDELPFAIVEAGTDRAIGSTRFLEIRREWRTLEIGWSWLATSAQHTGVNTETKFLLLRHAFEDLGALRVQFITDLRNTRAQKSLERLGAVREGVLRKQRTNYDGFVRDSVYFSILDGEWPAVKQGLEQKLGGQVSEVG